MSIKLQEGDRRGYPVDERMAKFFVGREMELSVLNDFILPESPQSILVLTADHGMGKSHLLAKFWVDCQARGILFDWFDFRDAGAEPQPLSILRKTSQLINHPSLDPLIEEIDRAIESNASALVQACHAQDHRGSAQYRLDRTALTLEFIRMTRQLPSQDKQPAVLVLDSYEMAGADIRDWLKDWFLCEYILTTLKTGNRPVKFIFSGREHDFTEDGTPLGWGSAFFKSHFRFLELGLLDEVSCRNYIMETMQLRPDETSLRDALFHVKGRPLGVALWSMAERGRSQS